MSIIIEKIKILNNPSIAPNVVLIYNEKTREIIYRMCIDEMWPRIVIMEISVRNKWDEDDS